MNKEYDNTNRGALFKNSEPKTDKSPEYTGSINVDGKEFYLNGWVKDGKKGKFFSLSVKPKEQKQVAKPQMQAQKPQRFEDSEIPF